MADFLSVMGSMASLIGLSIQVYERFSEKNPSQLGQYMGVLIIITDTAECWKDIHHRYQALSSDLDAIYRNLIETDGRNVKAKQLAEIAPNKIRNIFESEHLQEAVYSFSTDLSASFGPLRIASALSRADEEKLLNEIKNFGRNDLTWRVQQINSLQKETVKIHDHVCEFFTDVQKMLEIPSWGEEQISYILRNRAYFHTRFDKNIKNADTALLHFFSIVKFVVDEFRDGAAKAKESRRGWN